MKPPVLALSTRVFKDSMALVVAYDGFSFIADCLTDEVFLARLKRVSDETNKVHALIDIPQDMPASAVTNVGDLVLSECRALLRARSRVIWVQRKGYYRVCFSTDVRFPKGTVWSPGENAPRCAVE